MPLSHYDRLTAADETFLALEESTTHMHIGAVCVYDLGPLRTPQGGLDIGRIHKQTEAALLSVPRFRQKLATIPIFGRPVWVDDPHFNLSYHVRHTALPRPGDLRQLKRLAARILEHQLDRHKPLWEMWFIEGLEHDRFAVVLKAHHCMVDGVAGADLLGILMRVDPRDAAEGLEQPWRPRPQPTAAELVVGEIGRRLTLIPGALRAGRELIVRPQRTLRAVADVAQGLAELASVTPASPTPINVPIGPHRRFDWTRFDLAAMRGIGRQLGATVNDVALAMVTGALRSLWLQRGLTIDGLDCRALVSVNIRSGPEHGTFGNRVSTLLAGLALDERDPRRRVQRMAETMRAAKASKQILGTEVIEELSDWTFAPLLATFARLAIRTHPYTIDVTNVPGPPTPMHLLGAELREIYPLTPLVDGQALAIALFSYNGSLHWGFNADWEAMPELHEFVGTVEREFGILRRAMTARPPDIAGTRASPRHRSKRPASRRHGRVAAR